MSHQANGRKDNAGSQLPIDCEPMLSPSATPAALALHNNFKTSVDALKRDLVRVIHYLTAISDKKIHRMLEYKSIYEYGETVAGFTEHQTRAFLKIGRRLKDLPEVKNALAKGILSWTKAEKIASRANPGDELEWIDLAQSMSARELGRHDFKPRQVPAPVLNPPTHKAIPDSSSRPKPKPPRPATEKCHVTFVLTPSEYSRWEVLMGQGSGRSKEELLLEGMVRLSEGVGDAKTAPPEHLIITHECPSCGQATLNNSRGAFQVDKPLLETARCDATIQNEEGRRHSVIPPLLRRKVLARDQNSCQNPGCQHTRFLQIHHRVPVAEGGKTEFGNLITLCSGCHLRIHADEANLKMRGKDPVR